MTGADNQQERSIFTPDFLAGLIVGEGSYYIFVYRQKSGCIHLSPGFAMRMKDGDTMGCVYRSFDHYGLSYTKPAKYKGCVAIQTVGVEKMRSHLDFFLPLLFGTKLQSAKLVSEFVDRAFGRQNRRYTEEDLQTLMRLREINGPSATRVPIEILRDYMLRPSRRHAPKVATSG